MENHNHHFLYQYARSIFDEELQRFRNLEEKAAKFFGFLTAGIAVYTFLLGELATEIFPPQNFFQGCACIAAGLTYAAMMSAWSFLYRAIDLKKMPRLPLDDDLITAYKQEPLHKVHLALARSCAKALEAARDQNTQKARLLTQSYEDITFAMWTLSASIVFTLIAIWLTHKGG